MMNQDHVAGTGEDVTRLPMAAPPISTAGAGYDRAPVTEAIGGHSMLVSPSEEGYYANDPSYYQQERPESALSDPALRSPMASSAHYGRPYDNSSAHGYTPVIGRVPSNVQGDFVANMPPQEAYPKAADYESVNSLPAAQPADPFSWMSSNETHEPDDDLHDPAKPLRGGVRSPARGFFNIGTMLIVVLALLMLFVGYPVLHHYTDGAEEESQQKQLQEGRNAKDPYMPPEYRSKSRLYGPADGKTKNNLIDPDTPPEAHTISSTYAPNKNKTFHLVFSDEFNVDGRSFYPGDDPYWEAVDLHYWGTSNYEWYDPEAITTRDGKLEIKLEEHPEHNLNFRGGMLQSWNKFCYTGGLLIASIQMPGDPQAGGLWPAFWIMGNLGRAGYGASLQGTWPYSYDQCDVGTVINQTLYNGTDGGPWPENNTKGGDVGFNTKHHTRSLSFLPGQKLSACTCPGDDHPGPSPDVGRAAPEIDVFEGQIGDGDVGVSQSFQMAPYNYLYDIIAAAPDEPDLVHPTKRINDSRVFSSYNHGWKLNVYTGEITQQSLSGTDQGSKTAVQFRADRYPEHERFATYSVEYKPGYDGYVSWTSAGNKTWELHPGALSPDPRTHIGRQTFPKEPMYIILNLGISKNFGDVDWDKLTPLWRKYGSMTMKVDWVRVYQDPDLINEDSVGCDPKSMPTKKYIERHADAYHNANYTVWGTGGYNATWPRNKLYGNGKACDYPAIRDPGDNTAKIPYPHAEPATTKDFISKKYPKDKDMQIRVQIEQLGMYAGNDYPSGINDPNPPI